MKQLQTLSPLWGKTEQVLKPGAEPTFGGYTQVPGTAATPSTTGIVEYYTDQWGNKYPAEPGATSLSSWGPIEPNVKAGILTPHYGTSAGSPGTPGYTDYNKPIWTYSPDQYETKEITPNFLAEHQMGVAGADPLQAWAAAHISDLLNTPQGENTATLYGLLAPQIAGKMATGEGVMQDPAVIAASKAFEQLNAPGIENQMGLAGLGKSSSLANSLALSKTQYMLPLIQDYITRQQNAINNQAQMYGNLMPQFAGLGAAETNRLTAALNDASQMGATMRGIAQEPLTAAYQDFLRRQALAEQALFVPFGAMATASIGPQATSESRQSGTSTGKMSQGMFK
jgi:hypothetical protein